MNFSKNCIFILMPALILTKSKILSVGALHKEWTELNNVRKIIIYVEEHVYLTGKWRSNKTEHNLIEMKRSESYMLNHNFYGECEKTR